MVRMKKYKLGECLTVKHGWAFKGEFFEEKGEQCILTPGNFYEKGGFKPNSGKERYYSGDYPEEYLLQKRGFNSSYDTASRRTPWKYSDCSKRQ